ncbi:Uncharacterised protein [Vibrio cholerae]|nr:Uncharacterised protein [Vibrio cholerae]
MRSNSLGSIFSLKTDSSFLSRLYSLDSSLSLSDSPIKLRAFSTSPTNFPTEKAS